MSAKTFPDSIDVQYLPQGLPVPSLCLLCWQHPWTLNRSNFLFPTSSQIVLLLQDIFCTISIFSQTTIPVSYFHYSGQHHMLYKNLNINFLNHWQLGPNFIHPTGGNVHLRRFATCTWAQEELERDQILTWTGGCCTHMYTWTADAPRVHVRMSVAHTVAGYLKTWVPGFGVSARAYTHTWRSVG